MKARFLCEPNRLPVPAHFILPPTAHQAMVTFSAQQKQDILRHYQAGVRGAGADALAARFSVPGGGNTVRYWLRSWDGTAQSLQHKPRSGRPRILSSRQVQQYVRAPILAANRSRKAVSYTRLLPTVRQKTGKRLSIQTLRRYGKQELGVKKRRTKKRTEKECESKTGTTREKNAFSFKLAD